MQWRKITHPKRVRILTQLLKLIIAVMNIVMVLAGLALYENIFSLCAVLGAILQTGAFWITDERKIRLVSFFGAPMWLLYNTVNHAYGSAIGSVLSIISIGIAILRYDILKPRDGEGK